jgi:hypothetical protein
MARAGRLVTRSRRRAARLHLVRPEHSIWTHCKTCVQLHRRMLRCTWVVRSCESVVGAFAEAETAA